VPGSLSFYGTFAISDEWGGPSSDPNRDHGIYLEHCGSRLHQLIDPNGWPLSANEHAVAWTINGTGREVDGVFLPTRRRFVFNAPSAYVSDVVLSSRELYVVADHGRIWSTTSPVAPARSSSRGRDGIHARHR
jgi:hypothetical protein